MPAKSAKSPNKAIEKAFISANGVREFAGQKLSPFTPQRMAVASEMGMQWGYAAAYKPQFLYKDSIIILWLCAVSTGRVDDAEGDPAAALKDAYKWAERNRLSIMAPRFKEATELFFAITKEIRESRGEPIPRPGDARGGGDDPGE